MLSGIGVMHTCSTVRGLAGLWNSFHCFLQDLKQEQERIRKTNIVVCTPGRLLQHMDETPDFNCNSLQVLGNSFSSFCSVFSSSSFYFTTPRTSDQTLSFSLTLPGHILSGEEDLIFNLVQFFS